VPGPPLAKNFFGAWRESNLGKNNASFRSSRVSTNSPQLRPNTGLKNCCRHWHYVQGERFAGLAGWFLFGMWRIGARIMSSSGFNVNISPRYVRSCLSLVEMGKIPVFLGGWNRGGARQRFFWFPLARFRKEFPDLTDFHSGKEIDSFLKQFDIPRNPLRSKCQVVHEKRVEIFSAFKISG